MKNRVQEFILSGDDSEEAFNDIALQLFAYQYEHNRPLRRYCRKRRVSPARIAHYSEIPPVPIAAFKEATFSCCPPEEAGAVFMTSGTTNPHKRGKNYHLDLDIYDLSMKTHFKACVLPDVEQIKMAVLFPTEKEMPHSSLAHYLHTAKQTFGAEGSIYVVGQKGFDLPVLISFIQEAEQSGEPILLIGATFSFIHFLDHCVEHELQFNLPAGSRVMDTGGSKGRSREMAPAEFKRQMSRLLSIPEYACVNMYGMTELSSQFYDRHFSDKHKGNPIDDHKVGPHWVRTRVVNPETMAERKMGDKGILVHYDLANVNSVLAMMTEDIGLAEKQGFYLLGRATGAEAKGCSLAVEQLMAAAKDERWS